MNRAMVLLAALAAHSAAYAIAASQAWVENYVSNYLAQTPAAVQAATTVTASNGCTVIAVSQGASDEMRLVIEPFTVRALMATNSTEWGYGGLGVTNGTLWVWNGRGAYTNGGTDIFCTPSNFVFYGYGSVATNGVDHFANPFEDMPYFDVVGILLQPSVAFSVTNHNPEVSQ